MGKIEQSKTYTGEQMEKIIFRPIVELADPAGIGASIMYNMPVPTTLHFWEPDVNVLQKFSASGWNGSPNAGRCCFFLCKSPPSA